MYKDSFHFALCTSRRYTYNIRNSIQALNAANLILIISLIAHQKPIEVVNHCWCWILMWTCAAHSLDAVYCSLFLETRETKLIIIILLFSYDEQFILVHLSYIREGINYRNKIIKLRASAQASSTRSISFIYRIYLYFIIDTHTHE